MRVVVQHAVGDPGWRPTVLAPEAVRRFARIVEDAGYAALGFTDHPAPTSKWSRAGGEGSADLFSSLAFCAAVTESIRLMSFVAVLGYRNPFAFAHQAATVDVLSAGRLDLGVGTGYLKGEMRALGLDPAKRLQRFDETLEVAMRIWSEEELTEEGLDWSARGVHGQPTPVQRPHPPLWVHGNSAFGRERAARYGAGWIGLMTDDRLASTIRTPAMRDLDAAAAAIADLRTRIMRAGRHPGDVSIGLTGLWPILDVRRGWDRDVMLADARAAARIGVDTLFVTVIGDDPGAACATVEAFGDVVAELKQLE